MAGKRFRSRSRANNCTIKNDKKWMKAAGVENEDGQEDTGGEEDGQQLSRLVLQCAMARQALLSKIAVVGMFDSSVYSNFNYWLANSNLNGFELDFLFLATFMRNSYNGEQFVEGFEQSTAIRLRQEKPPRQICHVHHCRWRDALFVRHYINLHY